MSSNSTPGSGDWYPNDGTASGQGPSYGEGQTYGQPGGGPPPGPAADSWSWDPSYGPMRMGAPKPGIIPLRPLTFGEFFDGAFRAIQHNPLTLLGVSLLVSVVFAVIQYVTTRPLTDWIMRMPGSGSSEVDVLIQQGVPGILSTLLSSAVTVVLSGLLVVPVSESIIGRKISTGDMFRRSKPRIWPLVLTSLIVILATSIGPMVVSSGLFLLLGTLASSGAAPLVILFPFLALALLVVTVWLSIRLAMAGPAVMLEQISPVDALKRSFDLTRGFTMRNLGVTIVAALVVAAIALAISLPIGLVSGMFYVFGTQVLAIAAVVSVIAQTLSTAISVPFSAAVTVLLYVDLRMRKEGLDVALARAAGAG